MHGSKVVTLVLAAVLVFCSFPGVVSADNSIAVTYDANGASSGAVPVDTLNYTAGSPVSVLDNIGGLARKGFLFDGWNTVGDGSGQRYSAGQTFNIGSGSVTLFAQWVACYWVAYDGNGATEGTVPADGNSYITGDTVQILGNTGGLTQDGLVLNGWNTKADGSGEPYAADGTFTMGAENITLYAHWSAKETCDVSFSAGEKGELKSSGQFTGLHYGDEFPAAPQVAAANGYEWTGWSPVLPEKVVEDGVYTAQYHAVNYTITYALNGGAVNPANPDRYTVETAAFTLNNPSKAGYQFLGWSGTGIDGVALSVTIPAGSTGKRSYTAVWQNTQQKTANLTGITVSSGKLSPQFTKTRTSYKLTLGENDAGVTITPIKENDDAAMTIRCNGLSSSDGLSIPLANGKSAVAKVEVTYPGVPKKTYTVTVTRPKSTDSRLASLSVDNGVLSPSFDPNVTTYSVHLNADSNTVTISDTTTGLAKTSQPSKTYLLNYGQHKSVKITVIAQAGNRRTYTINIYRDADGNNIAPQCGFSLTSNGSQFKKAIDGYLSTVWTSKKGAQSISITIPQNESDLAGIYIRWSANLIPWELDEVDAGESRVVAQDANPVYYAELIKIPAEFSKSKRFVLTSKDPNQSFSIAELSVYNAQIPYFVPDWHPYDSKPVDTMVVACHPDDEDLYMGPGVPTTVEAGKKPIVVYMTAVSPVRRIEAQESVWCLGETVCPVLRMATDKKTLSLSKAERVRGWSEKESVGYIVEQIRKYKPSVIMTHDTNGEYGHGAHRLTSYCVKEAVLAAGDANQFPDSAKEYGVWTPKKLYIHLYGQNKVFLNVHRTLSQYHGMTMFSVIARAYDRHQSQLPGRILPIDGKPYDMECYGLYWTSVGYDAPNSNNLFQNVG